MPRLSPADAVKALLYCGEAFVDQWLELIVGEDVRPILLDPLTNQFAYIERIDARGYSIFYHPQEFRARSFGRGLLHRAGEPLRDIPLRVHDFRANEAWAQHRDANSYGLAVFEALLRCDSAKAQAALNDLEEIIAANPDVSSEIHAWRLCARICVDRIRGSVAQAALDELREVSQANQSPANLLLCKGVMSSGYLQIDDLVAAKESACEAAAVLQQCSVVWAAFGVFGAGGATQTLIALWERATRERWNDQVPIKETAQRAMRRFFRLSRRSPVCRPWALLLRGQTASLAGDQTAARQHWSQAIHVGQRLDMQYVVGLACLEIGASIPDEDRSRNDYLIRAQNLFATLGVSSDLTRVQNALAA